MVSCKCRLSLFIVLLFKSLMDQFPCVNFDTFTCIIYGILSRSRFDCTKTKNVHLMSANNRYLADKLFYVHFSSTDDVNASWIMYNLDVGVRHSITVWPSRTLRRVHSSPNVTFVFVQEVVCVSVWLSVRLWAGICPESCGQIVLKLELSSD